MPKKNPKVDAYIAAAAPFAQPILKHLRALVHEVCPEAEEELKWSNPTFLYHGKLLCSIPAFKAHMALGFWHHEMDTLIAKELGTTDRMMRAIGRIERAEDLPTDPQLRRYLKRAMELVDGGTPGRPRAAGKKKPEAKVPPDLAERLKRSKQAAATWESFSPSHRREYVEWITEAKRDETREKRLKTTLEWLVEGKARNWKYANC